ncbi:MAG: glycosyltransferase [Ignavibacteriales bacterium]|nr:glycosyltransferase [Ignavibacteriales bacterium]
MEWYAFKFIDVFFVLDKRIINYLPKSNKKIKIEVSTTGVDEEIFIPIDKKEARRMLGLNPDQKYILYIGSLNYTKRPDILIDIYEEIKKERNDVELILAGNEKSDPLYQKAKNSAAILYGKILQTELYKYLSAADVYVLPKYKSDMIFRHCYAAGTGNAL